MHNLHVPEERTSVQLFSFWYKWKMNQPMHKIQDHGRSAEWNTKLFALYRLNTVKSNTVNSKLRLYSIFLPI